MGNCCSGDSAVANKPPEVTSVTFYVATKDGKIDREVKTFEPTTPTFNLTGKISRRYDGVFTFNWVAVDTYGIAPPNYEIVSVSAQATGCDLFSKAELPRTWPEGEYRVDILAGGALIYSAPFTVKASDGNKEPLSLTISLFKEHPSNSKEDVPTDGYSPDDDVWLIRYNANRNQPGASVQFRFTMADGSPTSIEPFSCDHVVTQYLCRVPARRGTRPGTYKVEVVVDDKAMAAKEFVVGTPP